MEEEEGGGVSKLNWKDNNFEWVNNYLAWKNIEEDGIFCMCLKTNMIDLYNGRKMRWEKIQSKRIEETDKDEAKDDIGSYHTLLLCISLWRLFVLFRLEWIVVIIRIAVIIVIHGGIILIILIITIIIVAILMATTRMSMLVVLARVSRWIMRGRSILPFVIIIGERGRSKRDW